MMEHKFFKSIAYLIILSIITTVIWYFRLEHIGMPIYGGIIFALLLIEKNSITILPFLLNMLFMISKTKAEWSMDSIPGYLYVIPVLLLIGFIINIIRFKPKFFQGMLLLPLMLMFAGMLLSMLNMEIIDINYLFYIMVGLFYLFIYFFFRSSMTGDNLQFLIRLFAILGVMISVQVLLYYLHVDDVVYALEHKRIDLGWGLSNFIATYLLMFIPAMFYFVKKYKFHVFWVVLAVLEIVALLFTLSRGGILTFVGILVFLIIYLFHGYENKRKMTLNVISGLIVLAVVVIVKQNYFVTIYERLLDRAFDDTGRYEIWLEGIEKFKQNPILGVGLYARVINDNYFSHYHNTIIHTAVSMGVVGLVALFWQFINIARVFIKKINVETSILFIAILGANIHGLIDVVYFMPQFMILFFIVIAAVENRNKVVLEVK